MNRRVPLANAARGCPINSLQVVTVRTEVQPGQQAKPVTDAA